MDARAVALIAAMAALCACAGRAPPPGPAVEVSIPVETRPATPAALLAPFTAPLPEFVAPSDPAAAAALTPEGIRRFQGMILEMHGRLNAWRAWGDQ